MKLHFEQHGDGEIPIVILHGFLGSGENWRSIAKILSNSYSVYLPDLRNHGKSGHDPEMTFDAMSEDIAKMITEEWSLSQVHLVGHSMGGKVALTINEKYPQILSHLYVLDISSKKYKGGHESILDAMESLDLSKVEKRSDAGILLSEGIPDQTVRQFLLKNVVRNSEGSYTWRIGLEYLIESYHLLQEEISLDQGLSTPMSLLYGTKSTYLGPEDIKKFESTFKQTNVYPFEAGHWLHAEQPAKVIKIITESIKGEKS